MTNEQLAAHLEAQEKRLLSVDTRSIVETIDILLADDFLEIGASGAVYDKAKIRRLLPLETPTQRTLSHFSLLCRENDTAVVIYRVVREAEDLPPAETARSSVWVFRDKRWQMRYHQGTWSPTPT